MKTMRLIALVMLAMTVTGCQNVRNALFPGDKKQGVQDPGSICRATPGHAIRDVTFPLATRLTDNTEVFTGETNGEDGVTESVTLCKRNTANELVDCQTAGGTGTLADGTLVEFAPASITIKLAVTNGYARADVLVEYTCHGG